MFGRIVPLLLGACLFGDVVIDDIERFDVKQWSSRFAVLSVKDDGSSVLAVDADLSQSSYAWFRRTIPAGSIPASCNALRFRAKSDRAQQFSVSFAFVDGKTESKFTANLGLSAEWKDYVIPFSDMRLAGRSIGDSDRAKVTYIFFSVSKQSERAFAAVDDIAFTTASQTTAKVPSGHGEPPLKAFTAMTIPAALAFREILLTKKEVDETKARSSRPPVASGFGYIITNAEKHLAATFTVPEREAKHVSLYVCRKDSAALKTVSPTEHKCPVCSTVYTGEPYDGVMYYWQHMRAEERAFDLALAYLLTGNTAYAAASAQVLSGYAARYASYPIHDVNGKASGSGARVFPQTLDEAMWLIPLAQAFAAVYDTLDRGTIDTIRRDLFLPAAAVIRRHDARVGNWQSWHNAAMLAAGLVCEDRELVTAALNGTSGFLAQMESSFGDDGIWYEGSWGYHFYSMDALLALSETAARAGIDVYGNARYKKLFDAPIAFMNQRAMLPTINDDKKSYAVLNARSFYEPAYKRWKDSRYAWLLSRTPYGGRTSILSGIYENPSPAPMPDLPSALFPDMGYAALRSGMGADDTHISFKYGPHGGWHGHYDKLSVVLFALGETLAPDPGCLSSYSVPLHGEWYKTTLSHNTMLVDGKPQPACAGTLRHFMAAPNLSSISASVTDAYPDVALTRTIVLMRGYTFLFDTAVSGSEHAYDWVWHNYGTPETSLAFAPAEAIGTANGYQHIKGLKKCAVSDGWQIDFKKGPRNTRLSMAGGETELYLGSGIGTTVTEQVPMVIARRTGNSAVYASLIEAYRGTNIVTARMQEIPTASGDGKAYEITVGAGHDIIICTKGRGKTAAGGAATDAKLAVASIRGGVPMLLAYMNGTAAECGSLSVSSSSPSSVYLERYGASYYVQSSGNEKTRVSISGVPAMSVFELDTENKRVREIRTSGMAWEAAAGKAYELASGTGTAVGELIAADKKARQSTSSAEYPVSTKVIPASARPGAAGVVIEAESYTGEANGSVEVRDKVGASGKAIMRWNDASHWLSWNVSVPSDGLYHIAVKYCTELTPVRSLVIDGAHPNAACRALSFEPTGGWSSSIDNWKVQPLSDENGIPMQFYLEKGDHVLRLVNISGEGGMNLDQILLTPASRAK